MINLRKLKERTLSSEPKTVTRMLNEARAGDQRKIYDLYDVLRSDLHRIARSKLRQERNNYTVDTNHLMDSAFRQLVGRYEFKSRSAFFRAATNVMKHLLIDHARSRVGTRDPRLRVEFQEDTSAYKWPIETILGVDKAMAVLKGKNARRALILDFKYFGDLTHDEIAVILNISEATVRRELLLGESELRRLLTCHAL